MRSVFPPTRHIAKHRSDRQCHTVVDSSVARRFAYHTIKRAVDIAVAGVGLMVLFPLLLVLGALIELTSPGPVLYAWNVVGRGGRPFRGYKFRTMVQNADDLKARLSHLNEMSGPVFKIKGDPRVTPIGKVLRKYSLDELPQLWSVLKGDMSLVGPRPVLATEWARFEDWQRRKFSVTPGLTCLWQANGRNKISDFEEWVRLDLEYIDRWSLWLDAKILAKTALAVIRGTGY